MIQNELNQTINFISQIEENQSPDITQALWHAAIMSYARCFTDSKGRGSKLDKNTINLLDKNLKSFHAFVMQLRNEYVAHAGHNSQKMTITSIALTPCSIEKKIQGVHYFSVDTIGSGDEHYVSMINLCSELISMVRIKKEKLKEIYSKFIKAKVLMIFMKIQLTNI